MWPLQHASFCLPNVVIPNPATVATDFGICNESIHWKMDSLSKRERGKVRDTLINSSHFLFTSSEQADIQKALLFFRLNGISKLGTCKHRQINVDVWKHSYMSTQAHIYAQWHWWIAHYKERQQSPSIFHEHPSSFCSLSSFLKIFILACSAFFLPKKVSYLSISSQKIARVRRHWQKSKRREKRKKVIRVGGKALRGL